VRRLVLVALGLAIAATLACKSKPLTKRVGGTEVVGDEIKLSDPLTQDDIEGIGLAVKTVLDGGQAKFPGVLRDSSGSAFVALRADGEELCEVWGPDGKLAASLREGLLEAQKLVGDDFERVDAVEIDLAHDFHVISETTKKGIKHHASNRHRGIRGLEFAVGDHFHRVAPTQMLADNRRFREEVDLFWGAAEVSEEVFASSGRARWFEAEQILVQLGDAPRATHLLRGNVLVEDEEVTPANTEKLAKAMAHWLTQHVREDGRMTYTWFPATSTEIDDNNMIRQWMATNSLERWADDRNDQATWDLVEKNIDYNLEQFYEEGADGIGYIRFGPHAKLGGISLAAMALIRHPKRAKWAAQEAGLLRCVDALFNDNGSFDNYYIPRKYGAPNVHNFYPGETLLLWSWVYLDNKDPELLKRFMQSFEYYSKWHKEVLRKPSFTPWHTQAYYNVWSVTKDEGLRDFVFEMNDWLVSEMALWEDFVYRDERGRFFSRKREKDKFGPPHASSTGVYLEGLIDAYRMAKEVGDKERAERYRLAMARGLRSMMQLQFVDDVDMYYVTNRDMTRGGIRTSVFRSEIRVDNVQHPLMGIIKILREFEPDDYSVE
jgi:hypothetical protein